MAEVHHLQVACSAPHAAAEDSAEQLSAGLTSGEEGNDDSVAISKPKDHAEVLAAIKKQVEFYFSDANLPTDKHLLKQIQKDIEGYVPLRMIANFKRVKALTKDLAVVAEALEDSTLLGLDEDRTRVRRAAPLPTFDVTDITRRTVVVEHLPDKPTIESVTQLLSQYGDVVMVRICSRGNTNKLPGWLAKAVDAINVTMAPGEFALVEFGSEEDCVACINKTRNPDNWRTSLRVRHLLTNFKPAAKASSRPNSRSSLDHGSRQEAEGHSAVHHGKGHQQHHGRDREHSSSGDGRRSAAGKRPSYDGNKRASHDGQHYGQHQQQHKDEHHAAATGNGLPANISPVRTHAVPLAEAQLAASPHGNAAARGDGDVLSTSALSPIKTIPGSGVGGAIGSPRTIRSPAPPEVTSFIDSILSAPTASTPTRDGRSSSGGAQDGRWSSSGGDWGSSNGGHLTPAAAVAAALAGVSTPPQSSSPRHSAAGTHSRSSMAGGAAPTTPTRLSTASNGIQIVSTQPSLTATQGALAAQLAAAAAAAAQAAMAGSPRAAQGSNAGNWRAGGASISAPNTPLAGLSAGDAVAEALEASFGLGSSSRPIPVGSPDLGSSPKPGPWIPASRLLHMQQAAAAGQDAVRSSGSEAEDNAGSWRSSWSGQAGSVPGSGMKPPKPRTSGGGAAQQNSNRQRRRSWHASEVDTDAAQAGVASSSLGEALTEGSHSDGSGAATSSAAGSKGSSGGGRRSRLAQPSGDYRSNVEAIQEASCELDAAIAAGTAMASLSIAERSGESSQQRRRSSNTGEQNASRDEGEEQDDEHEDGEQAHGKRRRRRRRSTGGRRASLDEQHPTGGNNSRRQSEEGHGRSSRRQSLDEPGGCKSGSRSGSKAGVLSAEEAAAHSRPQSGPGGTQSKPGSHSGSPNPGSHMAAAAAEHHRSGHEGAAKDGKKKEKKDYASWAAATPEFRAAAAKHGGSSNGGAAGASAGLLSSNAGRAGLSPLRASGGGATTGHDGDSHVRIARMPDGTRGFGLGRGRPLTPPNP